MIWLLISWILKILLVIVGSIVVWYIYFKLWGRKYWERQNIPFEEPFFLGGNTKEANSTRPLAHELDDLYKKHRNKPLIGVWLYIKPTILVIDLDLIRSILVKDFSHFHDRGMVYNEEREPLLAHLFNLSGQKWRNMRVKLTPTFTSGKMKMMYDTMFDVGQNLQKLLQSKQGTSVEMKEILASYTTDVIGSCAFGIEAKSLEDPNSEFRKYGKSLFENPPIHILISSILQFVAPWTAKYLPLRQNPKDATDFFMKAVKDVMHYREESKEKRQDFMQLLIELKQKGRIDDADAKYHENDDDLSGDPFTVEQAAAQAFVFFFAGFETSSTALTWTLYELALNPDLQERLQKEIDGTMKSDNKVSYNDLLSMEYMEQVVQESLRKYAPVPALFRECTKDYPVPGTDMVIRKGEFIWIPIDSIQNDPEYFPNPEKYDPERFSAEGRQSRDSFLEMAFGSGPRICIGNRFAMLQVKVALVVILSKFSVEVCESTPVPVVLDPKIFFPSPKGGMYLKITPRK